MNQDVIVKLGSGRIISVICSRQDTTGIVWQVGIQICSPLPLPFSLFMVITLDERVPIHYCIVYIVVHYMRLVSILLMGQNFNSVIKRSSLKLRSCLNIAGVGAAITLRSKYSAYFRLIEFFFALALYYIVSHCKYYILLMLM